MLAVTQADLRSLATEVSLSLLVGAPDGPERDDPSARVRRLWMDPGPLLGGRDHVMVDAPLDTSLVRVGDGYLAMLEPGGGHVAAVLSEAAAVLRYPDGGRRVVRADGYDVRLEPSLLRQGEDAVRAFDAGTPPGLVVLADPRDEREVPQPEGHGRRDRARWWLRTRRPLLVRVAVLVGLAVVALGGTAVALVTNHSPGPFLALPLVYAFVQRVSGGDGAGSGRRRGRR
ncbi:hypothetical protein GCM10025868_35520 [Angustibacter aerolatus]|uniref:Uncharacterized protein n=1 Tax=Angustibacter aerolatus TaxID=1162965 RepID=A0ABQ6JJ74_9ACTN|nr:hypothetical protein [Angustibacter aerolatus]GMA88302.1 hypothetical protein GCM10025868_35520 [Angustibacter aerolatus]